MPAHLQGYRQSVIDMHPGWDHRLWSDDDFGWLRNQELFDQASEITPGHEGQLRSDIARYEILAQHGGVYVDCDMEAVAPLDGLLSHQAFAGWELQGRWVNNAVLGATPCHPFVEAVVRAIPAAVQAAEGKNWRPNRITGPHLVTRIAKAHDVTILDEAVFYPYSWSALHDHERVYPNTLLRHHWDNARKRQGVPGG